MSDHDLTRISKRLLQPYRIPAECPYLSEDQRELSALDFKGRSAWMGEWLLLAAAAKSARASKTLPGRRVVRSWS
jgi:hypothetical protein